MNAAPAGSADYRHAVESFNRQEYDTAASILDKIRDDGNPKDRADILNLRGAIYMRQRRFDRARAFFSRARISDPGLWAASFNEAEADFEAKNYAQSRREFARLLADTPRPENPDGWALVQYKSLLSGLLSGDEKPVRAFLAEHAKDAVPPASYYFLNAACEFHQSHQKEGGEWLARAGASYSPGAEQVYAEAFTQMGWPMPPPDRAAVLADVNGSGASPVPGTPLKPSPSYSAGDSQTGNAQKLSPATLAVVQLIGHESTEKVAARETSVVSVDKPAFRYNGPVAIPLPAEQPAVENSPPGPADLKTASGVEGGMLVGGFPEPGLLARHRSTPTPSPSASPTDTPSDSPQSSPDASSGSPASGGGDASTASPGPSASASPTPGSSAAPALPAFVQKYEAAYVKFIQKDYDGAKVLLDEADAIQQNQPSSISLRGQIFKHYYEAAYVDYLKSDYPGAMAQLDLADGVQINQPDACNLRGLVFSREHNYDQAESMFKKAIQTDPTFWAAKFNLAELPFNYRNYTAARSRFEDLFSQTDPVKQPREAELTQFKVFLTLLLEGKEAGARSFMEHFTFSGSTPARYFCQSALDFYHGDVDKAMGWLDSAKKEYPAQLVSIFLESFYRVGWMTDPTAHPELAAASSAGVSGAFKGASPSPSASPAASASPALAVAAATPSASPTPAGTPAVAAASASPAASATPAVVAASSPAGTPSKAGSFSVVTSALPSPVASVAAATPAPTPVAARPTATPAPVVAAAKPLPSASASATPAPTAIAAAVPSATVAVAAAATAGPSASAEPMESAAASESPSPASAEEAAPAVESPTGEAIRYLFVIAVLAQTAFIWTKLIMAFRRRKLRRITGAGYRRPKSVEPDKVEAPR